MTGMRSFFRKSVPPSPNGDMPPVQTERDTTKRYDLEADPAACC